MIPKNKFFRHVLGFLFVFGLMVISFTAGYFITTWGFHYFHFNPPPYLLYMAEMTVSFLLLGLIGRITSQIFRAKQRNLFQEVIDALKKIASGDFSIQLETLKQEDPFKTLIDHINHMAQQLKQMEDLRQEFISNVSHEIQSPLTSIMGFARALQFEKLTDEERVHYLNIIETESRRLSKLSDNLLKLTSLESDQNPTERKSYRLDKQIRNIILTCEPNWNEKEISMDVFLDKASIVADEDLMSQVWMNLLHNSIKFTPRRGNIFIRLQQEDDKAIITISDTGIGISKKNQIHIFERFFKADKARDRSKGGSGLGLSIVKKIIDIHKGTIFVESEEGKGTKFTITIPINLYP
jgi:two-component system phosphate regulon sensor histidine kinase PhoR